MILLKTGIRPILHLNIVFYLVISMLTVAITLSGCDDQEVANVPAIPGGPSGPTNPNVVPSGVIPAFPGAEGFGSKTSGGRGGHIIAVTNLNERGPGSFRAAVETPGPRIIVFHTGGIITLTQRIQIAEPFVTIAGQTAPGDGIMFRGAEIRIETHDVIMRGIRLRVGDVNRAQDWDGIVLHTPPGQEVYNVIVDHCSVSWAIDENFGTFGSGAQVRDCTLSYNICSEGLNDSHHSGGTHSTGMLLSKNNVGKVSIHHNLFLHNVGRNPEVGPDATGEVINNVVYNFGIATKLDPGSKVNAIGNVYIPGPNTSPTVKGETNKGIRLDVVPGFPDMLLYVKHNIGPGRVSDEGDDWLAVGGGDENRHRSLTPVPDFEPSDINPHSVDELVEMVLNNAGAISPERDAVDMRLIEEFRMGIGRVIDSQEDVGGWPNMDPGTAPVDSDRDGMPDNWESQMGLNINDPSDAHLDSNDDGYTNIEEYINSFLVLKN